jgi:flagella synthesis protein FlgN
MNQLNDRQAQILIQALQQSQEAFGQLQQLLEQEQQCLKQNDRKALSAVVQEKSQALQAAQQSEQQLIALLNQLKCPLELAAMENLLALVPPRFKTIISNQWTRLSEAMRQCQRLNQVNGKVIARIRMGLASVVSTLKGQEPSTQIYQASGIQNTKGGSRLIAQA